MPRRERSARWLAVAVGVGATAAVLSPLATMDADSFPISSYPMFARPRGQPTLYAVVARTGDGSERRLAPSWLGSSEVLQAKVLIQRSVEQGPEATRALCNSVAQRIAEAPDTAELRSVEIVRRRYDPVAYFVDGPEPIEQQRVERCAVPRAASAKRSRK
ncbi:MAG TPA: hypothetical protein VMG12_19610 [Polyangiaceae bacterium]|nr:hypothetical protein [Polyangiaceae bacterium]